MAHARRFFVEGQYTEGTTLPLPDPLRHRLKKVLRLGVGDSLSLWNGMDGLWQAEINHENLKTVVLKSQIEPQMTQPKKVLMMGLPKREAWETILRQATELGVTDIYPLKTEFSVRDKLKEGRAQLIFIEAAEQCERLDIPTLHPLTTLADAVRAHQDPIYWAAERDPSAPDLPLYTTGSAFLIGPEGGFSESENTFLKEVAHVHATSLGPLILRADTAVPSILGKISL